MNLHKQTKNEDSSKANVKFQHLAKSFENQKYVPSDMFPNFDRVSVNLFRLLFETDLENLAKKRLYFENSSPWHFNQQLL